MYLNKLLFAPFALIAILCITSAVNAQGAPVGPPRVKTPEAVANMKPVNVLKPGTLISNPTPSSKLYYVPDSTHGNECYVLMSANGASMSVSCIKI